MQTDLFKPLRSVRGGDVFGFKPEVVLLVCIVVSWYCFKGRMYGVVGGAGLDYRLIDSWAFSAGGIAGSLWFLMRKDDERTRCAPLSWWPWVVACIAAVVGSAVAWAGGATTIALIARFCISVCITVLFLRVCILFIYQPFYVVVYAFLIIAIARICQCVVDWVTLQPVYSTLIQYLIGCVVLVAVFLVSSNKKEYFETLRCGASATSNKPLPLGEAGVESYRTRDELYKIARENGDRDSHIPWQFAIHVLLCFAVVGSTQVLTSLPLVRTDSALLALPCAIAATVLYYLAFARNIESSSYWTRVRQVFLPLAFLPFLLLLIGGPRLGMCAAILGEVASRFLLLSVYVGMFDVCRKSYVKAGEALAVVHVSFYAGLLIGSSATSSALTSALPGGAEAMPLVALVAFLCLVCALCWLGTDGQAEKLWGRGIDLTPRSKTEARTTERCQAIAHLFDLTQKEYEVLRRLVERKQAGQVADELCVSKNTVRTHMRNIYTKLDVHTQDDLLKFYNDFTMP